MRKLRIGITIGDINGIGLEVILKTLSHQTILDKFVPVIYGSSKIVSYHKNIIKTRDLPIANLNSIDQLADDKINIINCWNENVSINLGTPTNESGKYAYISLDRATEDVLNRRVDGLVTAPINKAAMQLADFPFKGHTDYLAHKSNNAQALMMMIGQYLKLALVTDHVQLKDVSNKITKESLERKMDILIRTLRDDFGIDRPHIAVLGLNPHAGDEGLIGQEDQQVIKPVIHNLQSQGHLVAGPLPADGFFASNQYKKYDAIVAMYHDQGLIPFKMLEFETGVNYTAGLPFIRTSPDHGTAYDIAGKNEADPSSFRQALYLAMDLITQRRELEELRKNALNKKPKPSELLEEEEENIQE